MANLVRLHGDRVELGAQAHLYSVTPAGSKLQAGLEAFRALQLDGSLYGLPPAERQQVTRFLAQFGHLLFRTLFPAGQLEALDPEEALWLELSQDWSAYPWELLNDGDQWLGLSRGVLRFADTPAPGPDRPWAAARGGAPLRVLAVSAEPLAPDPALRIGQESALLGTRFVTTLPHLADVDAGERLPIDYRVLSHASLAALEQALARQPHVLVFSGFASEEGWYLESDRLTAQCAPWDWLLQRLSAAVQHGLQLVVLADSLGMAQPLSAAQRTRALLRAGMAGVVRIEGRVGRERQTTYLRTLLRELAAGTPVTAAHQGALRSLFRTGADAWEWCFLRLYPQPLPRGTELATDTAQPLGMAAWTGASGPLPQEGRAAEGPFAAHPLAEQPFASPPEPPALTGRRRHFDRTGAQQRLLAALAPDAPGASPLVFVSGGPGSGKTHLALAVAQRLRRRFGQVLYLPQRALVPDPAVALAEAAQDAPGPEPAQWLSATLARHMGVPDADELTRSEVVEALQRRCGDGTPRLLILDRWEPLAGYDALVEALGTLPRTCRVLLVSRSLPPVRPGAHVALEPLGPDELRTVFGTELTGRLRNHCPDPALHGALQALCGRDLFLARLLRRAPRWPAPEALQAALLAGTPADAAEGIDPAELSRRLLTWLVDDTLLSLAPDALAVLSVLALLPWLAHRDVLAEGADLDAARLDGALEALAWLGWADAWDGGRYHSLHPRLHAELAQRLLGSGDLARLQPRLLRACQRLLAGTAGALREAAPGWLRAPVPLLGSDPARCEALPAEWVRHLHRLGVEQVNLAELALLLVESGDWRTLGHLVDDAAPLEALRELGGLTALLNRALLLAGERQADPVLQAHALNRLAAPLVEAQRAEQAVPMLERALQLLQRTAGWQVLGETQRLLSRCYELLGRLDAAESLLQSSAELARELGNASLLAHAGQGLARIWSREAQDAQAGESFLGHQADYLQQINRPLEAALVLRAQAALLAHRGQWDQAETRLETVLESCRAANHAAETARTLLLLADCRVAQGDPQGAFERVRESAASGAIGSAELEEQGRLLSEICRLFEQRQELQPALDGYLQIREVLEQIGDREALVAVLDRIGGLYYQLGDADRSTRCYEERLHLQAALQPS